MGFFSLTSASLHGVHAEAVRIEVDISFGLPRFSVVGLADAAVQESKERIRSAFHNSGFSFPSTVVTINLAPAHERKQGSHYDAPIALALLAAEDLVPHTHLHTVFLAAELGLAGDLRPVRGIIPLALFAQAHGMRHVIVAPEDAVHVAHIPGIFTHACKNLRDLVTLLALPTIPEAVERPHISCDQEDRFKTQTDAQNAHPFSAIRGNHLAKRALTLALAGKHAVLFIGPPGSGKTLLAKTAQHLLPPLTFAQALEVAAIHSLHDERRGDLFSRTRPFRAPHHHASAAAIIGGGSYILPGEISLAHHGVLFLDELPEFPQKTLEALRQPLEDKEVHIARASGHVRFPADVLLLCAMNPCPCGYFGDKERVCTCDQKKIHRYQERISGPLLDRIDLFVDVPRIPSEELVGVSEQMPSHISFPSSETLLATRTTQEEREHASEGALHRYEDLCALSPDARALFHKAIDRFHLSGRGYARLLRVSRTIADLAGSPELLCEHVSEALSFRSRLLVQR